MSIRSKGAYKKTLEGFDKFGRWRSRRWLEFVRSLRCECKDIRCPNCWDIIGTQSTRVVAAHLRTKHTGMGAKPDDFLVYPLSDHIHRVFHNEGHPSTAWQLNLVSAALREGMRCGVLKVSLSDEDANGHSVPI